MGAEGWGEEERVGEERVGEGGKGEMVVVDESCWGGSEKGENGKNEKEK